MQASASTPSNRLSTALIETLAVFLIWVFFYRFNLFVFAYFEYNPRVYWLFLPAGIRMLAVFIFGWRGVAGLFAGSIYTNEAETDAYVVGLAAISALSPMLALYACRWVFNISSTLKGLRARQLLYFTLTGALANSLFSQLYFYFMSTVESLHGLTPMFVGDVFGTLLVFYVIAKLLQLMSRVRKQSPPPINY